MICIGHRGAAGWEPQNTFLAFEKAITLGCDFIETDIHICKSGEMVLCHDAKIDSTSDGIGHIKDLTLEELRTFDFGKHQQIMTFEELLDQCRDRINLNLELKSDGSGAATAALLTDQIRLGTWKPYQLLITSFNHLELQIFHTLAPAIPTGALIKSVLIDEAEYVTSLGCKALVASLEFTSVELVRQMHAARIAVYVYTANDPRDIDYFIEMGVDGIISNYPDRVITKIR